MDSAALLKTESFFDLIPEELVYQILFSLSASELLAFGQTCKRYLEVAKSDEFWLDLFERRFFDFALPTADAFDAYRRHCGFCASLRRFECKKISVVKNFCPARGAQDPTLFSNVQMDDQDCFLVGGSVPVTTVYSRATKIKKFSLDFPGGLGLGYSSESKMVVGGGYQANCTAVFNVEADPIAFLRGQNIRYLKQCLAIRHKDFSTLREKSEFIDKLMASFDEGEVPRFPVHTNFEGGGDGGVIDVLIDNEDVFLGHQGDGVHQHRANLRDKSMTKVGQFVGHQSGVNCVRKAPNDQLLTAGNDGTVRVWDRATFKNLHTYQCSDRWLWCLAPTLDDHVFLTGGIDGIVSKYDRRQKQIVWRDYSTAEMAGLSLRSSNHMFATSSFDGCIRLYDDRMGGGCNLIGKQKLTTERLTRCTLTEKEIIATSFDGRLYVCNFFE